MSADSTRPRVYKRAMRIARRPLNHVALALLAAALACGDNDAPPKEPGEYGEACEIGEENGTPNGCAGSLYCDLGFCTPRCTVSEECPPIPGFEHVCGGFGFCKILCDDNDKCPQSFEVPLECYLSRCQPAEK